MINNQREALRWTVSGTYSWDSTSTVAFASCTARTAMPDGRAEKLWEPRNFFSFRAAGGGKTTRQRPGVLPHLRECLCCKPALGGADCAVRSDLSVVRRSDMSDRYMHSSRPRALR